MGRLVETEQVAYKGRVISTYLIARDVMPEARAYTIALENVGPVEFLFCGSAIQERVGKRGDMPEKMHAPWETQEGKVVVNTTTRKLLGGIVFSRRVDSIEAVPAPQENK